MLLPTALGERFVFPHRSLARRRGAHRPLSSPQWAHRAKFPTPSDETPDEALLALLKCRDLYEVDGHTTVSTDLAKIKVLKGNVTTKPLMDYLCDEGRELYSKPAVFIERAQDDVQREIDGGGVEQVRPHWDARLRSSRALRLKLLRRLLELGLGTSADAWVWGCWVMGLVMGLGLGLWPGRVGRWAWSVGCAWVRAGW